jgi:predicted MFS family arabinose efflux permease
MIGFSSALTFFASLSYSVANPDVKQHRAAIHESMVGLGSFSGAILFGELAGRFGTERPFLYAPAFMLAAVIVQYLFLRLGRRRTEAAR